MLKEKRRLVLAVRETPLHGGHLRTMTTLVDIGAIIAPVVPAFYNKPQTIDDIINHTVGRLLDLFGIDTGMVKRWQGGRRRIEAVIVRRRIEIDPQGRTQLPWRQGPTYDRGMKMRKQVLGEEYVNKAIANVDDFNRDFQRMVTQYCWGEWSDGTLKPRERSLLNLGMLAALGQMEEFQTHVRGALKTV